MVEDNIIVLDYKENFADNFSVYAYGKIAQKFFNKRCCYENNPLKRENFEKEMKYFSLDYEYISSSRVLEITKHAYMFDDLKEKKLKKADIITSKRFNISDIRFLNSEILSDLEFKNTDFIKNHDILDDIKTTNSIGVYIDKKDIQKSSVDLKFIENAFLRLNKYVKKPVIYIFSHDNLKNNLSIDTPIKNINNLDKKEEFYFLSNCKHQIITQNNSYSFSFWAALLNNKTYSLKVIKKEKRRTLKLNNWIEI